VTKIDVTIPTSYGATLEGRIVIEGNDRLETCAAALETGLQISAPCASAEPASRLRLVPFALDDRARADPPGTFVVSGNTFYLTGLFGPMAFALHRPDDWYRKALTVNGVDIADSGFDFGVGQQTIDSVELIVSQRGAAVSGRLRDDAAAGADYSVLVFPVFRDLWAPHSQRMKFVRSRGDGSFRMTGLPPGDYLVAAVNRIDGTPDGGEWQSPDVLQQLAPFTERVSLREAESRSVALPLIQR
jgi:hypothetical protein